MTESADRHFLEEIGRRIRRVRTQQGLSQEGLALACGLDRTYVGGVERGERNISIINLARISRALSVSVAALLTPDNGDCA